MKELLILLFLPFLMVSCSTSGGGPSQGKKPPVFEGPKTIYLSGTPVWKTMADVRKSLGSAVTISGTKVNLNGNRLSGKKIKHPKDKDDEKSIPLRIYIDGFQLTDGIIDDIPGGIVITAKNTKWKNLTFTTRGEDYISTIKDKAPGITIENCKFYNGGGDKSIQLNDANGALIKKSYVTGGITAARIQESSSKNKSVKARVESTTFDSVPTALNVDGYTTLELKGNTYKNVGQKIVKGSHVKIKEL